ncbi:8-oxo-dGTP diphosphatase [Deltaproteobacteria bacterium TL4]
MKLGVLVYIERQDGHVLMLHRKKQDEYQGLWLAPGGKVEKNETPFEAAIRETREETGFTLQNLTFKGMLSFPDQGESPFGDEWHVFIYHTFSFSGTLIPECAEGRLQWIPKAELTSLPMWEGDYHFTPKIFEGPCFSGKLTYKHHQLIEATFWDHG